MRQNITGCVVGATYTISGWMRGNSGLYSTCRVKVSPTASPDWSTAIDLNPPQVYTGDTWTQFSGTVVATGTNMTLWLDGQTGGTAENKAECFDSIRFTMSPSGRGSGTAADGSACHTPRVIAREAKFQIGQVVRHRIHPFRGVIFDVNPEFANSEAWWLAIPEAMRPRKDQPYYRLLAVNARTSYVAYVSEQNLLLDGENGPVAHPQVPELFGRLTEGQYELRFPKRSH